MAGELAMKLRLKFKGKVFLLFKVGISNCDINNDQADIFVFVKQLTEILCIEISHITLESRIIVPPDC